MAERPVRALRFTGFGLGWTWPLVNIVLEVLAKRELRSSIRGQALTPSGSKTTYANIETYEIFEDKTGVIRVKIHRRAERER